MNAATASRTVIVTGATGNLGRAVASAFKQRGDNLVLIGHRRESLASAFGAESAKQMFAAADLLNRSQVDAAVSSALERYQRLDVLCNIAGGFRMGAKVHENSDGVWNFLFDLNVRTVLTMVRAVVPHMIDAGAGCVVNVGAHSALKGVAEMGPYCAAKSTVIRITESMAAELREKSINVNCVLPTIIDTPENRAAMPKTDPKRWVAPEDLAKVFVFLTSDEAHAMHGASLSVSGLS